MHCEHAPCVEVCPVGASYRRADGIVMMDYDKCIGCRYCEVACPYGARAFNWKEHTEPNSAVPTWGEPEVPRRPRGVVEKCSFCAHRIDRGLAAGLTPGVDAAATPACVNACPVGARKFGDLNDPASEVSVLLANHASYRLREDLGTAPHVYYLPARKETASMSTHHRQVSLAQDHYSLSRLDVGVAHRHGVGRHRRRLRSCSKGYMSRI